MPDALGDVIHALVAAFPRERIQDYTIRVYREKLADVPVPLVEEAAHQLICTEQRFPTIAQIRQLVAELTLELPTETEALTQVEVRIRWQRGAPADPSDPTIVPPPPIHDAVREALNHIGGIAAFRGTDEPTILRGQFARYYREIRAARIRALQTAGGPQLPAPRAARALTA